ncbi:hypothetical protein A2165_04580 [Candidatus Curtissbacteria bacterium RBG_13_40_7]|uniref:Uncharacterized protein n=1 Tax=Candidatus Curtissbacteria bacterium RBG_13_40_7 TaxID=1797706 RepID=A0A1F5FZC9_9BACT|nr:MAG: hypothetical protein A2165_04580 [Candidatus Curtissbacteria bacterium RBG_13_40_7]
MDQPAAIRNSSVNTGLAISAKKRVEKQVLEVIIDGLNSGELTVEKAQEAARDTLAIVEKIEESEQSILNFYEDLSQKHPIFKLLYTQAKDQLTRSKEISAYNQALKAIDNGDVGIAHKIVTGAISQTAHETTNLN